MAKKRATKPRPETPRVMEIPPRCPRPGCGSTERTQREGTKKRIFQRTGFDRQGNRYNEQHICYVECSACGQRYCVSSLHYIVRDPNGNPVTSGK